MKKIKKIIIVLTVCIFIFFYLSNIIYATEITSENLNLGFQAYTNSDYNDDSLTCTVNDNEVIINANGSNYEMTYDLTENLSFTIKIPVYEGMSYSDYDEQTNYLFLPLIGYCATLYTQGVDIEDSYSYIFMTYLMEALSSSNSQNLYTIYDDTDLSEGVTIVKDESDESIIYASDFPEKVMDYVEALYGEETVVTDADYANSYEWVIGLEDVTDTSCNIVSTLTVDLEADFSQIAGYNTSFDLDSGVTEDNADYVINLKVGQKCKLESSEEITGYALFSNKCVEISDDYLEITATAVGETSGYIYLGYDDEKVTIYIIVEENSNNESLSTKTYYLSQSSTIEDSSSGNSSNTESSNSNNAISNSNSSNSSNAKTNSNSSNSSASSSDTTTASGSLPNTGSFNFIIGLVFLIIAISLIIKIKLKEYEDLK